MKGLSISISGLKESKRYKFRVAARNMMGMSLFTETRDPIEIKEQMCKSLCSPDKLSPYGLVLIYTLVLFLILQWNQRL